MEFQFSVNHPLCHVYGLGKYLRVHLPTMEVQSREKSIPSHRLTMADAT